MKIWKSEPTMHAIWMRVAPQSIVISLTFLNPQRSLQRRSEVIILRGVLSHIFKNNGHYSSSKRTSSKHLQPPLQDVEMVIFFISPCPFSHPRKFCNLFITKGVRIYLPRVRQDSHESRQKLCHYPCLARPP